VTRGGFLRLSRCLRRHLVTPWGQIPGSRDRLASPAGPKAGQGAACTPEERRQLASNARNV